jgi:hypothetical protein
MPCPSHSSRFFHPNKSGWGLKIIKLLSIYFYPLPLTSSLLGPNILLNTLFSNTLSLRSSPSMSDQVSHSYKNRQYSSSLYINLKFLDSKLGDKRFCTERQQAFPDFNLLLISSWIEFWFVNVVLKCLNFSTLSKEPLSQQWFKTISTQIQVISFLLVPTDLRDVICDLRTVNFRIKWTAPDLKHYL